jgi:hypothetical protein
MHPVLEDKKTSPNPERWGLGLFFLMRWQNPVLPPFCFLLVFFTNPIDPADRK